jgi:nitrite reductase/ring-hydroxylating ferredoxin subunit
MMKKYILLLLVLPFLVNCSKDDYNYSNKYLPNYSFSIDIDTSLPLYSQLQFPSNPVRITQAGIGINGVIVMNTGGGYTAFEATCPNQAMSTCSVLTINGILVKCPCDGVEYSLFTGQATTAVQYPLKPYKVSQISANVIRVYN